VQKDQKSRAADLAAIHSSLCICFDLLDRPLSILDILMSFKTVDHGQTWISWCFSKRWTLYMYEICPYILHICPWNASDQATGLFHMFSFRQVDLRTRFVGLIQTCRGRTTPKPADCARQIPSCGQFPFLRPRFSMSCRHLWKVLQKGQSLVEHRCFQVGQPCYSNLWLGLRMTSLWHANGFWRPQTPIDFPQINLCPDNFCLACLLHFDAAYVWALLRDPEAALDVSAKSPEAGMKVRLWCGNRLM
jgi:hypothetical protein